MMEPNMDMDLGPAAPPPHVKVDWRRAAKALGMVLQDTSRSDKVAELAVSLEGEGLEKCFQRFRALPEGRRLIKEGRPLVDSLLDRKRLENLPKDTLGYAYALYMNEERLDAEVFMEVTDVFVGGEGGEQVHFDPEREYFRNRIRDLHDLWHALTGYGADELGEAALLAFSQAQIPNLGVGVLAGTAFLFGPLGIPNARLGWQAYMARAYLRGKRATWLPVVRFEDLLETPLPQVQRKLGIAPARVAHPRGIYSFSRGQKRVRRIKKEWGFEWEPSAASRSKSFGPLRAVCGFEVKKLATL